MSATIERAGRETNYNGTLFRSKLEAEWARYFDANGYTWKYEPQAARAPGVYYQPDFLIWDPLHIPSAVEIKPWLPSVVGPELAKCEEWARHNTMGASLMVLFGTPGMHKVMLITAKTSKMVRK